MKKFYYSKETSQDESPIIFPSERRNTMDVNNGQGMSTRAASVNSLDLLSEAPTIPRVKTRDVTRSMSDVATRSQSKKQKLVTETELSSSWLYKTMQASINARFKSPRKSPSVHKEGDLEQSILRDPELKPIPVKSKAAKTSSCICHFATMIAISLCTIGFLASISAIIYMEIFADRNITSLHAAEAEVDISEVLLNSKEAFNLTTHEIEGEEHILSEALTHRFDGDEEILNGVLKASSTNDLPGLENKSKSDEQFPDYVTDAGKSETPEFNHINEKNSKIKFQDGVTVIYEMKPQESAENVDSGFNNELKGRSFGFDFNGIEEANSENNFGKSSENVRKDNLNQESDIYAESDKMILSDSVLTDNIEDTTKSHATLSENTLNEDFKQAISEDQLKSDVMSENRKPDELEKNVDTQQILKDGFLPSEKPNSSEIVQSQNIEEVANLDTDAVLQVNYQTDHSIELDKYTGDKTPVSNDSDKVSTNPSDFQAEKYDDEVFRSTLKADDSAVDDHDVNTMLVTVDDIEVSTDSFMSKRNGEINLFPVSSPVPSVEPVKQITGDLSVPPKKPVDIKVSLADAMKHLQKLDVNNKLLTSRTKSKQKPKMQKPKRKTLPNKDEERKRYLQHMRLMLFKQMQ